MSAGFTNVYASHLQDATGTPITNALISFLPVSSITGLPISFQSGGVNGITCAEAVTTLVTAGALNIILADTTATHPANIGYAVTVIDLLTGNSLLGPGYGCIQPTGASWCLDSYEPNLPTQVTVQYGPPGVPGAPGSIYGTVLQQVPSGAIDGSNVSFTVAGTPAIPMMFRNGLLQTAGVDYTYTVGSNTSTITFAGTAVPQTNDTLNFVGISSTAPSGSNSSSSPAASLQLTDAGTGQVRTLTVVNGTLELS